MVEYYDWYGDRLFRRDPDSGKEERWDEKAGGWVDVGDFVTREAIMDPDPQFNLMQEATAKEIYPGAFAAGVASIAAEKNEDAEGDSRFTALHVEDMSRIQSYIGGGSTVDQYIEDQGLDPIGDAADQARVYAEEMTKAYADATPEQAVHTPGEWT